MDLTFLLAVFLVSVLSGGTAAIAGFGIGSLLTPLFASTIGMTTAVAAVAIPHAIATAFRCWRLRKNIDGAVIRSFGILSAVGGIIGALLFTRSSNRALTVVLALLLIATGLAGLTNWARRLHIGPRAAGALGVASGLFGGIAGNQGGLRAAALLSFPLTPAAFVATSTAVGLLVDAARLPVYASRAGSALTPHVVPIAVSTVGVLIGTGLGERILLDMGVELFRKVLAIVADMTRREDVKRVVAETIERFGHIDVWINNVGQGITRLPSQLTDDDIDSMMRINVKTALYGMQEVLPHFRERNAGHVINVSSMLGRLSYALPRAAYTAAKHFLNPLTANFRDEFRESHPGIQFSIVSPPVVRTDFGNNAIHGGVDSRTVAKSQSPEEVAQVIADVIESREPDVYTEAGSHERVVRYFQSLGTDPRLK